MAILEAILENGKRTPIDSKKIVIQLKERKVTIEVRSKKDDAEFIMIKGEVNPIEAEARI